MLIASRLDFDVHTTDCRIAFFGSVLCSLPKKLKPSDRELLKVYKLKQKVGGGATSPPDCPTAI